ncbi:hypothetical protein PVAP13_2KG236600 [Panicum virgatum]|uniref:Uncharacterized protein n=1 Tax=Panicum virgatum TaxID=38727 RepID=A0A8T0W8M1_PANVG|nr:hypothetical protein PVAP13_2KG236600 [Panicum virgatum]
MAAVGIGADRMATLLCSEFGHPCAVHYDLRKNMCVYFCLDCQGLNEEAICFHCHVDNTSHRILQVRKASLSEVLRVVDLPGVIDITGIQIYSINGIRVIHLIKRSCVAYSPLGLKRRPQRFACVVCNRGLKDAVRFCSVQCKV